MLATGGMPAPIVGNDQPRKSCAFDHPCHSGIRTDVGISEKGNHKMLVMSQPRILMCPPDYYGIEYEINPWMSRSRASDRPTAVAQWQALVAILRGLGVQVD